MTTVADGGYRARLLGLLGERDPIESLEESAARIESAVTRLGEAGMSRAYGAGKWTGKQVLAHLADAEIAIGFRMRQVLAEDHHHIQGFDEGAWARRYQSVDLEAARRSFQAVRGWNLALIRALKKDDLARTAVHPERGEETLDTIVRLLAGHDLNHLGQLERL
jgi:hypothetical protein